jgi:hypothetical protein
VVECRKEYPDGFLGNNDICWDAEQILLEGGEMQPKRSADEMVNIILKNRNILDTIVKDPELELPKLADEAKKQTEIPNTPVYRTIVWALSVVAVVALIGAIALVGIGKSAPEVVIALGSAAIGALAGALIPQSQ